MARKHLQIKPHTSKHHSWAWWYEDFAGIMVVMDKAQHPTLPVFTIPWTAIRAALKRKDRPC